MSQSKYSPTAITPNFYQLGTHDFPAYLSIGDDIMLIEGGTGATAAILIEQIKELGIPPERFKYIALTHTHPDHIGAIPYLKAQWPHLKVIASAIGAEALKKEETLKIFHIIDQAIIKIQLAKGNIDVAPPSRDGYVFGADISVGEGDKIELGAGVIWTVHETPGHSPCHVSLYNEDDRTLVIGDATGFYVPEKDVFWPNYFQSLEVYCNSLRKLLDIPAKRGALCHNSVIEGDVREHLEKAMRATEQYHSEVMERLRNGEDFAKIAEEKARWINTYTDIQPFDSIHGLSKVLLKRSQTEAAKEGLFVMPEKVRVPVRKDLKKG